MDLRKWRIDTEHTQEDMAFVLRIDQAYYSKVELKRRRPSVALAKRIKQYTQGAVTLKDLGVKE